MADTDPNETPEQPEDAAPEAEGDSTEPQDAASDAPEASSDESPEPEAAEEEPKEQTEAERLAAAALAAAQAAVTGINAGEEGPIESEPSPAESAQIDFAALASEAAAETGDSDTDAASAEADAAMAAMLQGASAVNMPAFDAGKLADAPEGIDMLSDVNLDVTIELGRTRMYVEDVLKLSEGAVVELDKLAGDPVDIYVNQRHVARGEVLILNDNFCVRVNEIVDSHPEVAAG